jgi:hypothetical protein
MDSLQPWMRPSPRKALLISAANQKGPASFLAGPFTAMGRCINP